MGVARGKAVSFILQPFFSALLLFFLAVRNWVSLYIYYSSRNFHDWERVKVTNTMQETIWQQTLTL
jgi:hypothetical protein